MNQEIFFNNIKNNIINTLKEAKSDIKIAVAWLTDKDIIALLEDISKKVDVTLIINDDNINNKSLYEKLYYLDSKILLSKKLMHNKFCIIDSEIVINGSYNWTNKAKHNDENIQITKNNTDFIFKFLGEFERLSKNCTDYEEYIKYNKNSISKLADDFDNYYYKIKENKFPYLINFKNLTKSSINQRFREKQGCYLITTVKEEKSLYQLIFFLEIEYDIYKVFEILDIKIQYPAKSYWYVECNFKGIVGKLDDYNIAVAHNGSNTPFPETFLIDKNADIISEKYKYLKKLSQGIYYEEEVINTNDIKGKSFFKQLNLYNSKLEIFKKFRFIDLPFGTYSNEVGLIFSDENKKFGAVDVFGNFLIDFKYDCCILRYSEKKIEFIEAPYFEIKEDTPTKIYFYFDGYNFRRDREKKLQDMGYKYIEYDFSSKLIQKAVKFFNDKNSANIIFKSDAENFRKAEIKLKEIENNIKKTQEAKKFVQELEKIKSQKDGCYIATSVYGDFNHPKVILLRRFRDDKLAKLKVGQLFIKYYYLYSPYLVLYLYKKDRLNRMIKRVLNLTIDIIINKN